MVRSQYLFDKTQYSTYALIIFFISPANELGHVKLLLQHTGQAHVSISHAIMQLLNQIFANVNTKIMIDGAYKDKSVVDGTIYFNTDLICYWSIRIEACPTST